MNINVSKPILSLLDQRETGIVTYCRRRHARFLFEIPYQLLEIGVTGQQMFIYIFCNNDENANIKYIFEKSSTNLTKIVTLCL